MSSVVVIAACLAAGIGGTVIGIWLAHRAQRRQMPMNPTRLLATFDLVTTSTIRGYATELHRVMRSRYKEADKVPLIDLYALIDEVADTALENIKRTGPHAG